jgi:hypothetical protein
MPGDAAECEFSLDVAREALQRDRRRTTAAR